MRKLVIPTIDCDNQVRLSQVKAHDALIYEECSKYELYFPYFLIASLV